MRRDKWFLGRRKDDVCGAFSTPSWLYRMACCSCHGTLGYREAETQTEAARRDDSLKFY
jgi:hypothetical protein